MMRTMSWLLAAVTGTIFAGIVACQETAPRAETAPLHPVMAPAAAAEKPAPASAGPGMAAAAAATSAAAAPGKAASLPALTLHLAGDSTVSNYPSTTVQEGWGMEIGQFFTDKVTVDNQAIGGANVQTFRAGNWKKIMAALKPGDYVMMQFGANDSGTAHGPVSPADFATAFEQMADEVREKGATPIYVTPSAFYQWSGGKPDNARLAPYAAAMYTAGKARDVLVDDLNARGVEMLTQLGQAGANPLYLPTRTAAPAGRGGAAATAPAAGTATAPGGAPALLAVDKAHFNKAGATKMAQLVAEELKRIKSPLAAYLK